MTNYIYESIPIIIGKHEWRVIVRPFYLGGNCTEYQWRPLPHPGLPASWQEQEYWRHEKDWRGSTAMTPIWACPGRCENFTTARKPKSTGMCMASSRNRHRPRFSIEQPGRGHRAPIPAFPPP